MEGAKYGERFDLQNLIARDDHARRVFTQLLLNNVRILVLHLLNMLVYNVWSWRSIDAQILSVQPGSASFLHAAYRALGYLVLATCVKNESVSLMASGRSRQAFALWLYLYFQVFFQCWFVLKLEWILSCESWWRSIIITVLLEPKWRFRVYYGNPKWSRISRGHACLEM
jgi:hypothetical protein